MLNRVHAAAPFRSIAFLCLITLQVPIARSAVFLDPAAQARVRAATFEVVMRKPETDSLTYEKPLPLELLPFTERTDKYISVGTAFAIGDNRFVTAAHVLDAGRQTQFGQPALRDAAGVVHEIDQIHKYSWHQDFGVLSLKDKPAAAVFDVNREPKIDETVFAVGNALGEGIVIRDGLFTSRTPEQRDGSWKWIRFSAAASPGNSGGPLLDKQGRVIGVVLQKSENENLNYAVPISLVLDAPDDLARIDSEGMYWLPVMDTKETGRRKVDIQLPKSYAALSHDVVDYWESFFGELRGDLVRKNTDSIFPHGAGSAQLLHSAYLTNALNLISRGDDGVWQTFQPGEPKSAMLQANGYIAYGDLAGATFVKIRRPDDVAARAFYADSKLYMDTLLKAISWKRPVGREQVRITSFGPAKQESWHTDAYGRKWQLRSWNVEYQDTMVLSMSLPVPDGYVAMLAPTTTAGQWEALDNLRTMTNFAYLSYSGTLQQWRDFLQMPELWPAVLAGIHIDYDYRKSFRYRSGRIEFSFDHQQQKVEPDSLLNLSLAYFDEGDKVVWDVAGLSIMEQDTGGLLVALVRHTKPPASLPQAYTSKWEKVVAREFPFNAAAIENAGNTTIDSIYPYPQPAAAAAADDDVHYEIAYMKQGKHTQDEMNGALTKWFQGFTVLEK